MADVLGEIQLLITAKFDKAEKELEAAKGKAGKAGAELGDKIGSELDKAAGDSVAKGSFLERALGSKKVIAGGLAIAGLAATVGGAWTNASNDIQTATGATGKELDALEGSMQHVAGSVKGSLGEIAGFMGEIAAKTHLTGAPLEDLTRQLLALKDLGIAVSVADIGGALGKWAVPTDQWSGALDRLFKISQETGVALPTLLGRLADFEPTLNALGYNFDQASLLAARLPDTVLPALKASLADVSAAHANLADNSLKAEAAQARYDAAVAKSGEASLAARTAGADLAAVQALVALGSKDIAAGFAEQIAAVRNAATEQDALVIGMEQFGKKAGPAMVQAIRGGKFELDGLSTALADNGNTIQKTAKDHETFIGWLDRMKTKAAAAVGPIATQVTAFGALAAGAAPVIQGGAKLVAMWTAHAAAAVAASAGTTALAAAEGVEAVAATAAEAPTLGFAAAMVAVAAPVLAVIAVIALLVAAGYLLITHWDEVKAGAARVWGWLQDFFAAAVGFIVDHWLLLLGPIGLIIDNWDWLKQKAGEVWGWIQDKIAGVVDFIVAIPERIGGALSGVFDGVVAGFRAAWNAVARVINGAQFTLPSVSFLGHTFGGQTIGLPDLPILDSGGIVTGPTLAGLAMNSRPEVVAPLADLDKMLGLSAGERNGGGRGGLSIVVQPRALLGTKADLKRWIREALDDTGRDNGSTGLR